MKTKNRKVRRAADLAAELHDDDGVDPRTAFSRVAPRNAGSHRKALQLCKEVSRALSVALACDCGDPLLNALDVVAVEPLRGGARLRVNLRPTRDSVACDDSELLARLSDVRGFLRAEIAAAVSRRRAPELVFTIVPPEGGAT